jgi:hypothetical protein
MAKSQTVTQDQVDEFELLYPLLNSVLSEIKTLSAKKQDNALNIFKVKSMNRILERIKTLIAKEPVANFLDLLDEETLPSNSDALIILVQFEAALRTFKSDHYYLGSWNKVASKKRR